MTQAAPRATPRATPSATPQSHASDARHTQPVWRSNAITPRSPRALRAARTTQPARSFRIARAMPPLPSPPAGQPAGQGVGPCGDALRGLHCAPGHPIAPAAGSAGRDAARGPALRARLRHALAIAGAHSGDDARCSARPRAPDSGELALSLAEIAHGFRVGVFA